MNKINKETNSELFAELLEWMECCEVINEKHRREATYFGNALISITDSDKASKKLIGHWMSNTFVGSRNDGIDNDEIHEFIRVEPHEKTITVTEWRPVKLAN